MTTCQLCGRESDNSAFCSICEPRASRVADVDSQAVPQFRCTICGQIGTVGRCCGRDTREPLNEMARAEVDGQSSLPAKCTGCKIENGYKHTLWNAGGDRIGDYRESKEEVCFCDDCASAYDICEECSALLADEVFVPPCGDVLCPECRDKESEQ